MFARAQAVGSAFGFACIPIFPSFITLTSVAFPGVSLVPRWFALALIVACIPIALVLIAGNLTPPRMRPTLLWPGLTFLAAALLSFALGVNQRDGSVFMLVLLMVLVWHANVERFGRGEGYLRAIWWAYLTTGAIACLTAVAMVLLREPAGLYRIANGRAVGSFVLPGELAGYCLFLIPIAYALACTTKERALRIVAAIACAAGVAAMLLSFSRTGFVGLAIAVGFLIALRSRRGGIVRAGAVIAAALAVVLLLFNEHHNPSENYTRLSIWQAALGIIDRFPLTGVGPFGFSKLYPMVRLPDGDATAFHAHSLYLTFFAELGILGLLAFFWFLYAYARALIAALRSATPASGFVAAAIAAGVAGCLVQGLIDTVSVVIFGLLFPMLALSLVVARSPEPVR
jgi:putative inorganic carbon (HCO3(-)) transporter